MPRTLADWLTHIESVHFRSIDMTLDRVRRVAHGLRLNQPPKVISVAGTNGKGSCVAMLESILMQTDCCIGSYTSPHLVVYNERIRINGVPAADEEIIAAFEMIESKRKDIALTYFEFGTLAALQIMYWRNVDIALLEVGMGGRLDAVNMVNADVSIITSIGVDHVQWLGGDRESIAREKAGIMRFKKPTVCGDRSPPNSLLRIARSRDVDLWLPQCDYDFSNEHGRVGWDWQIQRPTARAALMRWLSLKKLPVPVIPGAEQIANAATVITTLAQSNLVPNLQEAEIRIGLQKARLPGRLQEFPGEVRTLFDVAHNVDAVEVLLKYLKTQSKYQQLFAVFSILKDKPVGEITNLLGSVVDEWHVAGSQGERGQSSSQTVEAILGANPQAIVTAHQDLVAAYEQAVAKAGASDLVLVFGSFLTVGGIMRHLNVLPYCH